MLFRNQLQILYLILNTGLMCSLLRNKRFITTTICLTFVLSVSFSFFANYLQNEEEVDVEAKDIFIGICVGAIGFIACCLIFLNILFQVWENFYGYLVKNQVAIWELKKAIEGSESPTVLLRERKENKFSLLMSNKRSQNFLPIKDGKDESPEVSAVINEQAVYLITSSSFLN